MIHTDKFCFWVESYDKWPDKHREEWRYTDDILYELCREKYPSHTHIGQIEAKLLFIGRGFKTNIEMKLQGEKKLSELAEHLKNRGGRVDDIVKHLNGLGDGLNSNNIGNVIGLHNQFYEIIKEKTIGGKAQLTSFASKYLHFHSPIVPIYDEFAQAGVKNMVRCFLQRQPSLAVDIGKYDEVYKNYCENFLRVYQKLQDRNKLISVRLVESFIFKTQRDCWKIKIPKRQKTVQ